MDSRAHTGTSCVCSGCSKRSLPKPTSIARSLCELLEKFPPRSLARFTSCTPRRARRRSTGDLRRTKGCGQCGGPSDRYAGPSEAWHTAGLTCLYTPMDDVIQPQKPRLTLDGGMLPKQGRSAGRVRHIPGVSSATLPQSQGFGSIPIWSLTADRIRCLQPRYRSVV
jgi:hypothetical protein